MRRFTHHLNTTSPYWICCFMSVPTLKDIYGAGVMACSAVKFHNSAFLRYATVGIISNATGYLIYIVLNLAGCGPKLAMTLTYGVGVLQTFLFNRRWSFRFTGTVAPALVRYIAAYASGYFINLLALMLLVDRLGLSHVLVQGFMILIIATMLFLAQKYWVFPRAPAGDAP